MGLKLETVVPWGRSLNEYLQMFDLSLTELSGKILDCAGGPASFNAQMTAQGFQVVSCDPIYQFTADEIEQRIRDTYDTIINGVRTHQDQYVWSAIASPEHLGAVRMAAMNQFLADFPTGFAEKRYLAAGLPTLPFEENAFDLALCSHCLFTYSDQFSAEFHVQAIAELCRVAAQVRIFPLLDIAGELSPHLTPVKQALEQQGYRLEIRQVPYEFQRGGNQMLQIRPLKSC